MRDAVEIGDGDIRAMKKRDAEATIKRMAELRELLVTFGLKLRGHDPGISAYQGSRLLDFDRHEWLWLEPLLNELKDLRNQVDLASAMITHLKGTTNNKDLAIHAQNWLRRESEIKRQRK